jgi:hypothetical protein
MIYKNKPQNYFIYKLQRKSEASFSLLLHNFDGRFKPLFIFKV